MTKEYKEIIDEVEKVYFSKNVSIVSAIIIAVGGCSDEIFMDGGNS